MGETWKDLPNSLATGRLVADSEAVAVEGIVEHVRHVFGWADGVEVSAGPRGALGQIWRLAVGPSRYALKELFAEPPTEALIAAELAFARRAAGAGVRLPASHPGPDGRYLLTTPDGRRLRLYDWVDLRPVEIAAPATPRELGALLARLHRCAPTAAVERTGDPPDSWYDSVPAAAELASVAAAAPGAAWSARLADRLATLPELTAAVTPVDPAGLVMCHRDLHPDNVLADPAGALVVVDWDNIGPAAPAREVAEALFDWFHDGPDVDLAAMRTMYEAYLRAGGPGRITQPADFSMLLAVRLNFILVQARVALDPRAAPPHREWAEREIDGTLHLLPTPQQLAAVLALARATG